MLGINDINEMRETIDRQNRIIAVLKRTVKQWVKEYNILDEIIDMYKMSENEANEIIAELEAKIKKYAAINEQETKDYAELKAENIKFTLDSKKLVAQYSAKLEQLKQTLEEIKKILLQAMDVKSDAYNHFLKVEQAIDLITKAEEE